MKHILEKKLLIIHVLFLWIIGCGDLAGGGTETGNPEVAIVHVRGDSVSVEARRGMRVALYGERTDLFPNSIALSGVIDSSGTYGFGSVPAGPYRLFAIDSLAGSAVRCDFVREQISDSVLPLAAAGRIEIQMDDSMYVCSIPYSPYVNIFADPSGLIVIALLPPGHYSYTVHSTKDVGVDTGNAMNPKPVIDSVTVGAGGFIEKTY